MEVGTGINPVPPIRLCAILESRTLSLLQHMRLRNCNFTTWRLNHDDDHKDKIFRSLYPYAIFRQIDFDPSLINVEQNIDFSYSKYIVIISKVEIQDNLRYRVTFSLTTEHKNFYTKWKFRTWGGEISNCILSGL